jgi:3-(3-hydroxy-phenyl)propionate hydroxylase
VILISPKSAGAPGGLRVFEDCAGRYAERYDARHGTVYLLRPDQHVAGRWRAFDVDRLRAALARATCNA